MNSQIRVATPILKCPVKILQRLINCTANYPFGVENVGNAQNQFLAVVASAKNVFRTEYHHIS
jgi:hypothetical protein